MARRKLPVIDPLPVTTARRRATEAAQLRQLLRCLPPAARAQGKRALALAFLRHFNDAFFAEAAAARTRTDG